jgi:transcription antitermination factor NusG
VGDGAKLYRESNSIMATNTFTTSDSLDYSQLGNLTESLPFWYVAYTSANHEKKAALEISRRGVETFLPVYQSVRRWSDRRVTIDKPLFPGYVFVRLALQNRLRVLQVPGVSKFIGFGGPPVALPDDQINILRAGLSHGLRAEPHPFLTVGRKVRLKSGPLTGLEGILLRRKGNFRVVISIELIQRAVAVDADVADIAPL